MAQVSKATYREARRRAGTADDMRKGGRSGRILERLRLDKVSKPVLAALVILALAAFVTGGLASIMALRDAGVFGDGSGGFAVLPASRSASSLQDADDEGTGGGNERPADSEQGEVEGSSEASSQAEVGDAPVQTIDTPVQSITVDVDGAVAVPGVYVLAQGARVVDAIVAAGGLTEEAETLSLNQAAPLSDGAKVVVPAQGQEGPGLVTEGGDQTVSAGTGIQTGLVNINTAGAEELQTLPGVGEATAQAILTERQDGGPFASAEDLMRVSGIGEKKLERLLPYICV